MSPAALPFIGAISPFFTSSESFTEAPAIPEPKTPPSLPKPTDDSPHRIPDFEFEQLSLQSVVTPTQAVNQKVTSPIRDSFQSTSTNSNRLSGLSENSNRLSGFSEGSNRLSGISESVSNRFSGISESTSFKSSSTGLSASSSNGDSTGKAAGKVRQRISREMIKETIQQRLADGSLSRKPVGVSPTGVDKDLPPPPGSLPMTKAHTTDATSAEERGKMTEERPQMRPRSQTQSAHEVAKLNAIQGSLGNPQSALDRLMANAKPVEGEKGRVVSTDANGAQPVYMPPGILQRVSQGEEKKRVASGKVEIVSEGTKAAAANGKKKEASGTRRRRSMSVGDTDIEETVSSSLTKLTDGRNRIATPSPVLDSLWESMRILGLYLTHSRMTFQTLDMM